MRRRRIEITVKTRQMIIRRTTNPAPGWCMECSSAARLITPEEAAALAGVSTRTIYRWVEAGQLHFTEPAEPSPLICLNSLLKSTAIRRK
jgi:Helix-turn-helix domain